MIWADWVFLGIVLLSTIIGTWRGFVREALSLGSWIVAIWLSRTFADTAGNWFARWVETPSLQLLAGFVLLFVVVLIVGAMVNHFAALALERTGLTGPDRALGTVFGLLRGLVLVVALVTVGLLLKLPRDPWWQESVVIEYFEPLALWALDLLPESIS